MPLLGILFMICLSIYLSICLSTYLSLLFIIDYQVGWVDIGPPEGIYVLSIYLFVY